MNTEPVAAVMLTHRNQEEEQEKTEEDCFTDEEIDSMDTREEKVTLLDCKKEGPNEAQDEVRERWVYPLLHAHTPFNKSTP